VQDKEFLEKIGRHFKRLRLEKGYSSHENFAFEYGLSSSYYWRLENGKVNIGMLYFHKLLQIHGLTPMDFFQACFDLE
jgi:transcriptional regulator with XRE-family HTH domain